MFPNLLQEFDKYLVNEFSRPRTGDTPSLQSRTIRTVQQKEDDRIRQEFEEYEKSHYVVDTETYLCMKGCVEAYKSPSSRNQFLDNTTIYQPSVSTNRFAVYVRGLYSTQELFICIHGTKLNSIEDILQDIQVVENTIESSSVTLRYLKHIHDIRNLYSSIPNDNIYISGHSLGAIYSLLGSKMLNVNGLGFNGATPLINLQLLSLSIAKIIKSVFDLRNIQDYDKFTSYRIAGDVVSVLSKLSLKNVITIDVKGVSDLGIWERHSMVTFLKFCIPLVPLKTDGLSRARRFGKLDDSRDQVQKEGQMFDVLRTQTETTPLGEMLKFLRNN